MQFLMPPFLAHAHVLIKFEHVYNVWYMVKYGPEDTETIHNSHFS